MKKKVPVATRLTDLQPGQFFIFWVAQATWVSLVALPVFAVNAIPRHLQPPMNWKDFLGITVWIAGFLIEVVADHQKAQWRKEKDQKKHDEDWISRGLWSKSRHPNYFGLLPEISSNYRGKYHLDWHFSLITSHSQFIYPTWWGYMMAISPLFTYLLLAKVSPTASQNNDRSQEFHRLKDQWTKDSVDEKIMKTTNARRQFSSQNYK